MLAIVIPYYKITYFEETLDSLANQTNKNFTVYIGNDNSLDSPEKLINKYSQEFKIIYKKFDNNIGNESLTKQWDRCINMVKEEKWFQILGDDDFLDNNFVAEFYNNLNKVNDLQIKVIRFATTLIFGRRKSGEKLEHPKIEKATDLFYRKFLEKSTRSALSEFIFKKDAYEKWGFRNFKLGWGADNFAWLEFSEFGLIYSINRTTCYVRMSNDNISRKGYLEDLKLKTKQHYIELLVRNHLEKFAPPIRIKLLLYYELLTYSANAINIKFWLRMNYYLFVEKEVLELIKMNRRIFLNYKKK